MIFPESFSRYVVQDKFAFKQKYTNTFLIDSCRVWGMIICFPGLQTKDFEEKKLFACRMFSMGLEIQDVKQKRMWILSLAIRDSKVEL